MYFPRESAVAYSNSTLPAIKGGGAELSHNVASVERTSVIDRLAFFILLSIRKAEYFQVVAESLDKGASETSLGAKSTSGA